MDNRKPYDTKIFFEIEIADYRNVRNKPIYILLEKKSKPYIKIDDVPFLKSTKVESLQAIANFFRKIDVNFNDSQWKIIARHIKAYLYPSY